MNYLEEITELDMCLEEYNELKDMNNRMFFIDQDIDEENLMELCKNIIRINCDDKGRKNKKPIKIFINTFGGDSYSAMFLYDVIKSSKTPVYTISTGKSMSTGFFILLSGHKRFAMKNTDAMFHLGSSGFNGTYAEFSSFAKNSSDKRDKFKEILLSNSKIDEEEYEKNKFVDWYFDANQLLEYGMVDKIVENIYDIM